MLERENQKPLDRIRGLTREIAQLCGENARISIDNNQAGRGLRGVVFGRRNHYGARCQRGTEVAALVDSPNRDRETRRARAQGVS